MSVEKFCERMERLADAAKAEGGGGRWTYDANQQHVGVVRYGIEWIIRAFKHAYGRFIAANDPDTVNAMVRVVRAAGAYVRAEQDPDPTTIVDIIAATAKHKAMVLELRAALDALHVEEGGDDE